MALRIVIRRECFDDGPNGGRRSPVACPSPFSNSGRRFDQVGTPRKYVKQVTGRHNDTELHLAAKKGDLDAVRRIIVGAAEQMEAADSGIADAAEIREMVANELNELGETALYIAAEVGHLEMVKELLIYASRDTMGRKSISGCTPLHIAAKNGHHEIVEVLLDHDPELSKTFDPKQETPLISAAAKGHVAVVNVLISKNSSLVEISRANGKNALHLAARGGHVNVVKALLERDPQLARRTDKKGQTALHMAAKGDNCQVVKMLLETDAAIVMLPDRKGNTALHIATRKKRLEVVNELLQLPDINVNALNRDHKTAYDIAEELQSSEEAMEIKGCLLRSGALRANDLNQPRDELRKTVSEIKKDVHTQLKQTRKTNKNVDRVAKELKKMHREGINNATNSVTVVAVLFATVAFAAIFTVPGGNDNNGRAIAVKYASFKIFFIFNAIALFTSLAVVVVQITLVRGETKTERQVVEVINKLMWLASVCTSVAFIASCYIVVGRYHQYAAIIVTVIGGVTMGGVLATMTWFVYKSRRLRSSRKKEKSKLSRKMSESWHGRSDPSSASDVERIYAI